MVLMFKVYFGIVFVYDNELTHKHKHAPDSWLVKHTLYNRNYRNNAHVLVNDHLDLYVWLCFFGRYHSVPYSWSDRHTHTHTWAIQNTIYSHQYITWIFGFWNRTTIYQMIMGLLCSMNNRHLHPFISFWSKNDMEICSF